MPEAAPIPPPDERDVIVGRLDAQDRWLTRRLDAQDERMVRMEADLAKSAAAAAATAAATTDLINFFAAFRGGFRTLEYIGMLAKPLGYILAVGAAVAGIWNTLRAGR